MLKYFFIISKKKKSNHNFPLLPVKYKENIKGKKKNIKCHWLAVGIATEKLKIHKIEIKSKNK